MHLVPYAFLLIVGVLGLVLLTADPEGGFQWTGKHHPGTCSWWRVDRPCGAATDQLEALARTA